MNFTHTAASPPNEYSIDVVNGLLRGELSAVEAYGQAIEIDCKLMIREKLLPPIIEHIATLDKLEHVA